MWYNRAKVTETRINTGLLAVFDWTQFVREHKIHSKSEVIFTSLYCFWYNSSYIDMA